MSGSSAGHEIGLQFSIYPLRQERLQPSIEAAAQAAAQAGLTLTVGRLSTVATGDADAVFAGLRAAFDAACAFGPAVMVATLSSAVPDAGTVAEIQVAAEG